MSDSAKKPAPSRSVIRLAIILLGLIGLATLVRRWALSKSDAEFEARLRAADEIRD